MVRNNLSGRRGSASANQRKGQVGKRRSHSSQSIPRSHSRYNEENYDVEDEYDNDYDSYENDLDEGYDEGYGTQSLYGNEENDEFENVKYASDIKLIKAPYSVKSYISSPCPRMLPYTVTLGMVELLDLPINNFILVILCRISTT